MEDVGGWHWLVRMEWHPAGWSVCLPLLILPCTVKSRSFLLAPSHPAGPGKRAVKRLCVCNKKARIGSHFFFLSTVLVRYILACLFCIPTCSTTHAYILYGGEQAASAAYESSLSTPVCLDDQQLIVRRYKELPEGSLKDRYLCHFTTRCCLGLPSWVRSLGLGLNLRSQ